MMSLLLVIYPIMNQYNHHYNLNWLIWSWWLSLIIMVNQCLTMALSPINHSNQPTTGLLLLSSLLTIITNHHNNHTTIIIIYPTITTINHMLLLIICYYYYLPYYYYTFTLITIILLLTTSWWPQRQVVSSTKRTVRRPTWRPPGPSAAPAQRWAPRRTECCGAWSGWAAERWSPCGGHVGGSHGSRGEVKDGGRMVREDGVMGYDLIWLKGWWMMGYDLR